MLVTFCNDFYTCDQWTKWHTCHWERWTMMTRKKIKSHNVDVRIQSKHIEDTSAVCTNDTIEKRDDKQSLSIESRLLHQNGNMSANTTHSIFSLAHSHFFFVGYKVDVRLVEKYVHKSSLSLFLFLFMKSLSFKSRCQSRRI